MRVPVDKVDLQRPRVIPAGLGVQNQLTKSMALLSSVDLELRI